MPLTPFLSHKLARAKPHKLVKTTSATITMTTTAAPTSDRAARAARRAMLSAHPMDGIPENSAVEAPRKTPRKTPNKKAKTSNTPKKPSKSPTPSIKTFAPIGANDKEEKFKAALAEATQWQLILSDENGTTRLAICRKHNKAGKISFADIVQALNDTDASTNGTRNDKKDYIDANERDKKQQGMPKTVWTNRTEISDIACF